MIEWFAYAQVGIAVLVGLVCLIAGFARRSPNDLTMGGIVLVEVLLLAQLVVAIVAPSTGNHATGDVFEFYTYLISAIIIPVAAGFWALLERSRWSTVVLGVAALAIAVMLYRMLQIWTVQTV